MQLRNRLGILAFLLLSGCATTQNRTAEAVPPTAPAEATREPAAGPERAPADDAETLARADDLDEFRTDAEAVTTRPLLESIDAVDQASDDEIQKMIDAEGAHVEQALHAEIALNPEERSKLLAYQAHLAELSKAPAPEKKHRLKKALKAVWKGIKLGTGFVFQGVAFTANAVDLAWTAPLRLSFKFVRGLSTGVPHRHAGPAWYKTIDDRSGYGSALMIYYSFHFFAAANPVLGIVFVSPIIDVIASQICENPPASAERLYRFCGRYNGMKKAVQKLTDEGDKAGASIHNLFGRLFSKRRRHPHDLDGKLCTFKDNKQLRLARGTIKRQFSYALDEDGVQSVSPMIEGGCVKIEVEVDERLARFVQAKYGNVVEGIAVVYRSL